jgi:hypothetical protein
MTRARVDRVSHEQEGLTVTAPAATAAKKPPLPRRRPIAQVALFVSRFQLASVPLASAPPQLEQVAG